MNTDLWKNVFKFLDVDSCEIACDVFGKPASRAFDQSVFMISVERDYETWVAYRERLRYFTSKKQANAYYDEVAAESGVRVKMFNWRMQVVR